MPLWVDFPSCVNVQVAPGRLMVWQGVGPTICRGPEMWGVPLGPAPCEFPGGLPPCRAGEAGPWFPSPSEPAGLKPCIALLSTPKLALPEDISALEKEMEQLAKELRQKRLTLGYSQADVGVAVGAMFGEMLSQTTICRFESQQLSLAKMWKVGPLLKMWLAEMNAKNHRGLWKMEMILQLSWPCSWSLCPQWPTAWSHS